jgi:hypothetical protein
MFYAKLDNEGNLERYPYTLTDLRRANPGTSFARTISDETAATFNCVPVTQVDPPADDYTKNYERSARNNAGTWEEQWNESNATADQIAERTTAKSNDVRQERNEKIAECDWTVLADSPLTTSQKTAWKTYRQALREITSGDDFPHNITWPSQP